MKSPFTDWSTQVSIRRPCQRVGSSSIRISLAEPAGVLFQGRTAGEAAQRHGVARSWPATILSLVYVPAVGACRVLNVQRILALHLSERNIFLRNRPRDGSRDFTTKKSLLSFILFAESREVGVVQNGRTEIRSFPGRVG